MIDIYIRHSQSKIDTPSSDALILMLPLIVGKDDSIEAKPKTL